MFSGKNIESQYRYFSIHGRKTGETREKDKKSAEKSFLYIKMIGNPQKKVKAHILYTKVYELS